MKNISVEKGDTRLTLTGSNLQYEIVKNGFSYVSDGRKPYVVFQKKIGKKFMWWPKKFTSARNVTHEVQGDGIVSVFEGFTVLGKKLAIGFKIAAEITDSGKVEFTLSAFNEEGTHVKAVHFPAPFNAKVYDKSNSYSVDPMRQGFMLPDTHKKNRFKLFIMTKYWRKINTGDAYLGVWGRVFGSRGYSAVIDNSYDCTLYSCRGKKRAFLTAANWIGQLGKLSYARRIIYTFYDKCDYVTIAKEYRNHLKAKGEFVHINEKIKSNENVKKLIGTPVIHWRLLECFSPKSQWYKKMKTREILNFTCGESAEVLKRLSRLGLDKAYIHTDGWGRHGYDNLHPYALPPSGKIGGYEGLRKLSDTCKQLNYSFGLHDQYRDYYHDCELYNAEECVTDINGKKPYCEIWAGGPHNWLCASLAMPYLKRTYNEFEQNGVRIDGVYLDVFGIMWGDECYHPNHTISREQSIKYRGECFDYLRGKGIITSSEEIGCQMVKYLDLVHHSPYTVCPQGGGKVLGVPIPLTNLVYHDSVFVPWHCDGKGGWGIPDGDSGRLHCILNGQSPYFTVDSKTYPGESDDDIKKRIEEAREAAAINAKVYNAEMVSHRFLDDNYRVAETVFDNGYVITVNFDADTYSVEKRGNNA